MSCFDCALAIHKLKICKGDCCGPVPFREEIYHKNKDKLQEEVLELLPFTGDLIVPITASGKCPFLDRKTFNCLVYRDRPGICRDFGVKGDQDIFLQCPHLKPNGGVRSEAGKKKVQRQIKKKGDQKLLNRSWL